MSASPTWMSLRRDAERIGNQVRDARSKDEALGKAIKAVETAMEALALANKNPVERNECRVLADRLIRQAERIKQSNNWQQEVQIDEPLNTRKLSTKEEIALLKSSFLNGGKFPPWDKIPSSENFELHRGEELFLDELSELSLSDAQLDLLEDWKRPQDAFPAASSSTSQHGFDQGPIMRAQRDIDLVQDAATDCSFVASLCALVTRERHGQANLLNSCLYPHDGSFPLISQNGKYIARLNFNGCYRKVVLDDRIPTSIGERSIHVIDRNNPSLLWPIILEKAYLKIRGGYDFPGSNSGTDLWILTGWIPEQVFLQSDEIDSDQLWRRISNSFAMGDVLITLGTGQMSSKTEDLVGLAAEHDYAVLDLAEIDGQRRLLVKNPWRERSSWHDTSTIFPKVDMPKDGLVEAQGPVLFEEQQSAGSATNSDNSDEQLPPGTFWASLHRVMQYFESIYLNWNTGLFSVRQDVHFTWDLSRPTDNTKAFPRGAHSSLHNHPQYTVTTHRRGMVWILLWRHFQNSIPEHATNEDIQSGRHHIDLGGHISLIAFSSGGHRVMLPDNYVEKSWFVDSPQTLLKLEDCGPGQVFTIGPLEQELPATNHNFTISAFADCPITLSEAAPRYPYSITLSAAWDEHSAGGNAQQPTYCQNPQFAIQLAQKTSFDVLVSALNTDFNVHVKLVHSKGKGERLHRIRKRAIVADSGDYRRGCCVIEMADLEAGSYGIIASTFEAQQSGAFTLVVESSQPLAHLSLLPRDHAGRPSQKLPPAIFPPEGVTRLAVALVPRRLTKLYAVASPRQSPPRPSQLRLTLELGRGAARRILAASDDGEFADTAAGPVRTDDILLNPMDLRRAACRECWLVLERRALSSAADPAYSRDDEVFDVEIFVDRIETPAAGEWMVWED